MKSKIYIKNIEINNNRVEYELDIEGDVIKYFNNKNMFVEYEENIESVPKGILVVPLMTNILPIIWIEDAELILDELDKTFYECIDEIRQGYIRMHKEIKFKGKVRVNKIINYSYQVQERTASFFSGGVDSLATVISKIYEKPDIVTIWGSDIKLDDIEGWSKVKHEIEEFGIDRDLNNIFIKSGFREFINEGKLSSKVTPLINDGWWHGIQHGIGLIGHMAPLAYLYRIKVVYVPSTFTKEYGHVSCASYPTIDNKVRFGSTKVIHDGFENNRQHKIGIISDYMKLSGKNLFVRVCWISRGGKNCSKCEKCYRTIMGLIAEHVDPNLCGFDVNNSTLNDIRNKVVDEYIFKSKDIITWRFIQDRFRDNIEFWRQNEEVKWILDINLLKHSKKNKIKKNIKLLYYVFNAKVKNIMGN